MSICMACGTTHDCQSVQHILAGWRGEKSEAERLRAHSAKLSEALGVAREALESAHRGCGDSNTEPLDENGGDQKERGEDIVTALSTIRDMAGSAAADGGRR